MCCTGNREVGIGGGGGTGGEVTACRETGIGGGGGAEGAGGRKVDCKDVGIGGGGETGAGQIGLASTLGKGGGVGMEVSLPCPTWSLGRDPNGAAVESELSSRKGPVGDKGDEVSAGREGMPVPSDCRIVRSFSCERKTKDSCAPAMVESLLVPELLCFVRLSRRCVPLTYDANDPILLLFEREAV